MADKQDQVVINFGPARYDSPKAINRNIETSLQETKDEIESNIESPFWNGTVESYDPATGLGTYRDDEGNTFPFDNPPGDYYVPGDEIWGFEDGMGEDHALTPGDRDGSVIGVDQPIPTIDPSFPLQLDNKTFPILPDGRTTPSTDNGHRSVAWDIAGEFGLGLDLIIGNNTSPTGATAVNAFCRETSASLSLFTPNNTAQARYYIQPGGRLISFDRTTLRSLAYRLPADTAWTVPSVGTARWAIDYQTGFLWGITDSAATSPFGHIVYRFAPTDTAPVNMGAMNIPNANTGSSNPTIAAGWGYLTASSLTGTGIRTYCVKPSSDNTNFVQLGTFSTASFDPAGNFTRLEVDKDGATTYLARVGSPITLRLRTLGQNLIVSSYDTGIADANNHGSNHSHLDSGLVAILSSVDATLFGGTAGQFAPALSTFNYSSTVYQYYNLTLGTGSSGTAPRFGGIVEIEPGTIRFTMGGSSNSYAVELSGL